MNMSGYTNRAWYPFDKTWGYYRLIDGVLWKTDSDKDDTPIGEPYRIDETAGYEHIIKALKQYCLEE